MEDCIFDLSAKTNIEDIWVQALRKMFRSNYWNWTYDEIMHPGIFLQIYLDKKWQFMTLVRRGVRNGTYPGPHSKRVPSSSQNPDCRNGIFSRHIKGKVSWVRSNWIVWWINYLCKLLDKTTVQGALVDTITTLDPNIIYYKSSDLHKIDLGMHMLF